MNYQHILENYQKMFYYIYWIRTMYSVEVEPLQRSTVLYVR